MDNLRALSDGEYNNSADLLGDSPDFQELLGRISRLPKEKQSGAIKNILKGNGMPAGAGNSRHEFERKFLQLPKEIRDGLLNKRLQLGDTRLYVVKDIAGKNSIDVFQGIDQKGVGLGSLANQKLEKDNWFVLFAIMMRYAVSASGYSDADFTHIPPIIRNGEFELEAGNKQLLGIMDNTAFDTRERTDIQIGYYKLDNTKVIEPQVEIKMPVKFTGAAIANTFLRVNFIGSGVLPY